MNVRKTMEQKDRKWRKQKKCFWSRRLLAILCAMVIGMASGCEEQKENDTLEVGYYQIYYLNIEETKLVAETVKPEKTAVEDLAEELMLAMEHSPDDLSLHKAKPDDVFVKQITFGNNGQLTVDFNAAYKNMEPVREILFRAAVVKMLGQIEEVDFIQFNVEGQPLTGQNEKVIGFMSSESFIDNTGTETNDYQNVSMVLYFANQDGTKLKETHLIRSYDGTIPMEQLVIQQLLLGVEAIEGLDNGYYNTFPDGTKLLKTTTKEGICHVDFSEEFLNKRDGITDEVAIYSVVNSLVELSSINKVQFTINEKSVEVFGDGTKLDVFFERNLDIVQ